MAQSNSNPDIDDVLTKLFEIKEALYHKLAPKSERVDGDRFADKNFLAKYRNNHSTPALDAFFTTLDQHSKNNSLLQQSQELMQFRNALSRYLRVSFTTGLERPRNDEDKLALKDVLTKNGGLLEKLSDALNTDRENLIAENTAFKHFIGEEEEKGHKQFPTQLTTTAAVAKRQQALQAKYPQLKFLSPEEILKAQEALAQKQSATKTPAAIVAVAPVVTPPQPQRITELTDNQIKDVMAFIRSTLKSESSISSRLGSTLRFGMFNKTDKMLANRYINLWQAFLTIPDVTATTFQSAVAYCIESNINETRSYNMRKHGGKYFPDNKIDLGKIYEKVANKIISLSRPAFKNIIAMVVAKTHLSDLNVLLKNMNPPFTRKELNDLDKQIQQQRLKGFDNHNKSM